MELKDIIISHLEQSAAVKRQVGEVCIPAISSAIDLIENAFKNGNKLMICGNGGSAADSQHMAAEFTSRLTKDFDRPSLPALALTTDTSFLTAFANDCGYDGIFARQIEGLGKNGDVLLGITTSGGSKNVLLAIEQCQKMGISVVALTGQDGLRGASADSVIAVPSNDTQFVQESHLSIEHIICAQVEQRLYGQP
jgi:D-sedoheptulose 7-phosphate isomerase